MHLFSDCFLKYLIDILTSPTIFEKSTILFYRLDDKHNELNYSKRGTLLVNQIPS